MMLSAFAAIQSLISCSEEAMRHLAGAVAGVVSEVVAGEGPGKELRSLLRVLG